MTAEEFTQALRTRCAEWPSDQVRDWAVEVLADELDRQLRWIQCHQVAKALATPAEGVWSDIGKERIARLPATAH